MCTNVYHKLYWLHHLLVMQLSKEDVYQCVSQAVLVTPSNCHANGQKICVPVCVTSCIGYTNYLSCNWAKKMYITGCIGYTIYLSCCNWAKKMCANVYHKLYWLHHILVMELGKEDVYQPVSQAVICYTIYLSCNWAKKMCTNVYHRLYWLHHLHVMQLAKKMYTNMYHRLYWLHHLLVLQLGKEDVYQCVSQAVLVTPSTCHTNGQRSVPVNRTHFIVLHHLLVIQMDRSVPVYCIHSIVLHHLLVIQMDREVYQCIAHTVLCYTIYLSYKWTEKCTSVSHTLYCVTPSTCHKTNRSMCSSSVSHMK